MNNIGDSSNTLDLIGLQKLKSQSKLDPGNKEALHKAAQHFESIFIGMMLKSMRKANEVFEEGNPMHSNTTKFFRDMYDSQLATDMADQGSLGLADIIVQQLGGEDEQFKHASLLRNDNQFGDLVNNMSAKPSVNDLSTAETADKFSLNGLRYNDQVNDDQSKARLFKDLDVSNIKNVSLSGKPTAEQPSGIEAVSVANSQNSKVTKPQFNFDSPKDFVESVWAFAKKNASKIGLNPAVMVAQSALETGWGQHVLKDKEGNSSLNLFNVKALRDWQGDKTSQSTLEFENGVAVKKVEPFRVYKNLDESFNDFITFLQSSGRYDKALSNSDKPEQFLQDLQEAGYATDPNYAKKIIGILNSDNFQEMISPFSTNSESD